MASNEPTYHVHRPEDGLCGYCGERSADKCVFIYCPRCPPGCDKGVKPEKVR